MKAAVLQAFGQPLTLVDVPRPEPLQFSALAIVSGECRIVGSAVGTRDDLRTTLDLAARGKLRCHCHPRPLHEVDAALDALRASQVQGRTVLIPS